MTFINYSTEKTGLFASHLKYKEEGTDHKVDPKEEHVRRVEARAASEPLRAKRHPAYHRKKGNTIIIRPHQRINKQNKKHVPAIYFSCAEHDDPIMPRGVTLHDLVYDERGERSGAKYGQQLERDDGRVSRAPACVCGGVFTPCTVHRKQPKPRMDVSPCGWIISKRVATRVEK